MDQQIPPTVRRVKPKDHLVAVIAGGILAVLVCIYLYFFWLRTEQPAAPAPEAPPVAAAPEEPADEPGIRYPMQPSAEDAPPLPALEDSDTAMRAALAELLAGQTLKPFHTDSIARRVVVTLDELPRKKLPQKYNIAKPAGGKFLVAGSDDNLTIKPDNYRRYAPYVTLAEAVDTKKLVAVYAYFYPLLEAEYRNLGHPKTYFNDRVVEAIDDMLATPLVSEPVRLVQNKVLYEFADPKLEDLSAGQKIMLRIGRENAARMKAKLREIRAELTKGATIGGEGGSGH